MLARVTGWDHRTRHHCGTKPLINLWAAHIGPSAAQLCAPVWWGVWGVRASATASAHANHVLAAPPMLVSGSRYSVRNPDRTLSVMNKLFFIRAEWDKEAAVWVATSDDVPGLATEAATMEALSDKLGDLVPELLALNGYAVAGEIAYEVLARKLSITRAAAIA